MGNAAGRVFLRGAATPAGFGSWGQCRAMRDFVIIAAVCLFPAFVADRLWLGSKCSGNVTPEWVLDFSSMRHR
jgi:hypothetical protein